MFSRTARLTLAVSCFLTVVTLSGCGSSESHGNKQRHVTRPARQSSNGQPAVPTAISSDPCSFGDPTRYFNGTTTATVKGLVRIGCSQAVHIAEEFRRSNPKKLYDTSFNADGYACHLAVPVAQDGPNACWRGTPYTSSGFLIY